MRRSAAQLRERAEGLGSEVRAGVRRFRQLAARDGVPSAVRAGTRAARRRLAADPPRRAAHRAEPPSSTRSFAMGLPPARRPGAWPSALQVRAPRELYVPRRLEESGLGGYETETLACLLGLFDHLGEGVFFDVGANMGVFALVAATLTPWEVVAFEPAPSLAEVARRCAHDNDLRVTVEQIALGRTPGAATLYLSDTSDTSNSLAAGFRPSQRQVTVPVETLDGYVDRTGRRPTVLKVDTESTEPDVFAGAATLLAEHRPWIVCEVLAGRTERGLTAVLEPHGYRWYQITREIPLVPRREIFGDRTHTYTNWLFAPERPDAAYWEVVRQRRQDLTALAGQRV